MFDLLAPVLSFLGGERANSANRAENATNREFQADQSATAYQRATKDMMAAGLNPMLAYSQGGASTPSGSTATQQDTITPAMQTAFQGSRVKAEVENMKATNENIYEQNKEIQSKVAVNNQTAENIRQDTILKQTQIPKLLADTEQSFASAGAINASIPKINAEINKITEEIKNIPKVGSQIEATIKNLMEQNKLISADVLYRRIQGALAHSQTQLTKGQSMQLRSLLPQLMDLNAAEISLKKSKIPGAKNVESFDESDVGKAMPYVEALGTAGSSASSILRAVPKKGLK